MTLRCLGGQGSRVRFHGSLGPDLLPDPLGAQAKARKRKAAADPPRTHTHTHNHRHLASGAPPPLSFQGRRICLSARGCSPELICRIFKAGVARRMVCMQLQPPGGG